MSRTSATSPHPGAETARAAAFPRRVWAQGLWEAKMMLRNGEQLLLILILPVLGLFALVHTGFLDHLGGDRAQLALPGIMAVATLSTAFTGQAIATGFDRRYGVLAHAATTPLGRTGFLAGKILAVSAVVVLQAIVLTSLAALLGAHLSWAALIPAVLALGLGIFAFTALGLFIAGAVRPEGTLAITNILWVLLSAAGGMIFPAASLGFPADLFVSLLPTAALGDALRAAVEHGAFDLRASLVMLLWGLAGTLLVRRTFSWE